MFPTLAAEVAALRAALAIHDRLGAKIALAVGEFDRDGAWDLDGATSMRAWLRDEGMCGPDAMRLQLIARRLVRLPVLAHAWAAGEVSNGQVRVIDKHLIDDHIDLFADHEPGLVPKLVGLSVEETNRAMTEWRARADAIRPPLPRAEPERGLQHSATLDNRFVTNGTFDALGGAVIAHALKIADSEDLDVAAPQRRADALVDVCSFFLAHHDKKLTSSRHRPHLNLIIDADDLCGDTPRAELAEFGIKLDAATTSQLLCDCKINRVVADKVARSVAAVLDYGRSTPNVSPNQWSALIVRDRHCRYPGCDRPASWCDAHHVHWFTKGGHTNMDNLVLLCRRHHRLLHTKRGYQAKLLPDATLSKSPCHQARPDTHVHPPEVPCSSPER